MYSKAEMQQLKREFWIAFAEKYPRKWILYDTKIKDFSFKFNADNKKAGVMLDIEMKDAGRRAFYFGKIESLKAILEDEFIGGLLYDSGLTLDNGKTIARIWAEQTATGMTNRANWDKIFDFFFEKMDAFERFFDEYGDYISG